MNFNPASIYHIYNQGNNKQLTFKDAEDYLNFIRLIRLYLKPVCNIVAYSCMPNHFHLMVSTHGFDCAMHKQGNLHIHVVTNGIRKLLSGYARLFNKKYHQTGSVFRQKTKAKCLDCSTAEVSDPLSVASYLLTCFHYIHQNPLRANLVKKLEDWEFSSYKDYASIRNGSLIEKNSLNIYGINWQDDFYNQSKQLINFSL